MLMRKILYVVFAIYCSTLKSAENTVTQKDIQEIKNELKVLVENYENRIAELEQRLQEAEEANEENAETSEALAIEISQQGNQKAANTYNPGIGLILNGRYMSTNATEPFDIPGFALAEETGPGDAGFSLGESEMNLSANIDDKFYASATLAFGEETEVEEAYLQTISLPNGLNIKAGRFFSDIGYLSNKHRHTDNFSDRPLVYDAFLGGGLGDDGLQITWLSPTDIYWQSGFELYRGENFPASGAANDGLGTWTAFTHIGNDFNENNSWRLGVSFLNSEVDERELSDSRYSGNSELWIADFIWKWIPNGNQSNNNATIQFEYLNRQEDGIVTNLENTSQAFKSKQDGWYFESIYQFMPQWRVGMRYSKLSTDSFTNEVTEELQNILNHTPKRTSLMVDWANSEFSRFRLQYTQDNSSTHTDNYWLIQYIAAFGAHGAHSF